MTTISSEDSSNNSAPRIFHISDNISSLLTSTSSDGPNVHRCPLCKKFKKVFFCNECVHNGLIFKNNKSLAEICVHFEDSKNNRKIIEATALETLKNIQESDTLHTKIRLGRERNRIIRLALEERRQKRQSLKQRLTEIRAKNKERTEKLKAYKSRTENLEDCVSKKCEDVAIVQEKLHETYKRVRKFSKLRVQQLFKYVFPITEVKPSIEMESSGDSTVKELAEASQTNYFRDMWVYTDYSNETQFSICGPCLPGSGNYSNYNLWAQNRDGLSLSEDTDMMEVNPTLTISSALTYTAQLVNVLSFILNVRLPYKMVYSEFSSTSLKERQFTRRVARLNANILYLCISQKVDMNVLSPTLTIHNILQLKDHESSDLGSQDPIEINDSQAKSFEQAISMDLKAMDDSDSEEGDSFTIEWEAVPHMQCPEASPGPAAVQSSVINTQVTSMAGGLVNSAVAGVASIWRGFTGR